MSSTVRLVNGKTPYSGRVEALREGSWVAVGTFDGMQASAKTLAAIVVCRSLGFVGDGPLVVEGASAFGPARPGPWLQLGSCAGTEGSLMDCTCLYGNHCAHASLLSSNVTEPLAITCPKPNCEFPACFCPRALRGHARQ